MPKVQRSPPVSPSKQTQSQTESDSSAADKPPTGSYKTAVRSKRLRMELSPQSNTENDLQDLKKELMVMLTSWKTDQDATLSKLVADITALKNQCFDIQTTNCGIEKSISSLGAQYEEVKNKIGKLELEKNQNTELLMALGKQMDEFQQLSRSSAIEIRNVTEEGKETEKELTEIIKNLGSTININIEDKDIRDIYRRPGKPGTTKAIVVEFNSVQFQNNFLHSTRRFNRNRQASEKLNHEHIGKSGDKRPIYVDEHLPYSTRKLLFQTREFAKQHNFKFCWISRGRVLLRKDSNTKYIHIKSEKCLPNLLTFL
ncbi:unnamed protein product [Diatraea saccharalis]|uniref:FP protein C-terminal domain-containing protein n=1 Tax=Diatraea saccharalis TaxID=40085 RepID=A0A9N9QUZ4_9NEOP|nr:unnamed protein product [Diatraea saccharalis]